MTDHDLKEDVQKIMEENNVPEDAWDFVYKESVMVDFHYSTKKINDDLTRLFSRYKKLNSQVFDKA